MSIKIRIKIVPDIAANLDGTWIERTLTDEFLANLPPGTMGLGPSWSARAALVKPLVPDGYHAIAIEQVK